MSEPAYDIQALEGASEFFADLATMGNPAPVAFQQAIDRTLASHEQLLAALIEIERLRLATNEGSLRVRADRMWEVATAAIASTRGTEP